MYTDFLKEIASFIEAEDIKIDEMMNKHTSFRVGGPAKVFLTVHSEESLRNILLALKRHELPYFVLGNGSNLLVSDEGYDGVMVYLGEEFSEVEITGTQMRAKAAALLGKVARMAMEEGLAGLEFAAGIPGSLGGGVVMNAGAYGGELSQVVTKVKAMNPNGEIIELEKDQLLLGYRTSIFKIKPFVILEVFMELQKGNKEEILAKIKEYTKARVEKQPLEYPNKMAEMYTLHDYHICLLHKPTSPLEVHSPTHLLPNLKVRLDSHAHLQ